MQSRGHRVVVHGAHGSRIVRRGAALRRARDRACPSAASARQASSRCAAPFARRRSTSSIRIARPTPGSPRLALRAREPRARPCSCARATFPSRCRTTARHRWLYRKATARLVTTGEALRATLIRDNGIDPARIESIPTGIDAIALRARRPARRARRARPARRGAAWSASSPRCAAGRATATCSTPSRGFANRDARLVIVGDGPQRAALEAQVDALALRAACDVRRPAGRRRAVAARARRVRVAVVRERRRARRRCCRRCSAAWRASPRTRAPSPRSRATARPRWSSRREDAGALADGLDALLADDALRARLAANARAFVVPRYGLPAMLDRMEAAVPPRARRRGIAMTTVIATRSRFINQARSRRARDRGARQPAAQASGEGSPRAARPPSAAGRHADADAAHRQAARAVSGSGNRDDRAARDRAAVLDPSVWRPRAAVGPAARQRSAVLPNRGSTSRSSPATTATRGWRRRCMRAGSSPSRATPTSARTGPSTSCAAIPTCPPHGATWWPRCSTGRRLRLLRPATGPRQPRSPSPRRTQPYAVLHVGASTPLKLWPADRWAALAAWLAARGITPVWSAGRGEEAIVARLRSRPTVCVVRRTPRPAAVVAPVRECAAAGGAGHRRRAPRARRRRAARSRCSAPARPWSPARAISGATAPYRAVTVDPFPCRDQRVLFRREIEWVRRCARTPAQCPEHLCMQAISLDAVIAAAGELGVAV